MKHAVILFCVLFTILCAAAPSQAADYRGSGFKVALPGPWKLSEQKMKFCTEDGETIMLSSIAMGDDEKDKALDYYLDAYMQGIKEEGGPAGTALLSRGESKVAGLPARWILIPMDKADGTVYIKLYLFKKASRLFMLNHIFKATTNPDRNSFEDLIKTIVIE